MTDLENRLGRAIETHDIAALSRITTRLRFAENMTYDQLLAFAQKQVPTLMPMEWEDLMYEVDTYEGENGQ